MFKKKDIELPRQAKFDINNLPTDLPPIKFDDMNQQIPQGSQGANPGMQLPPFDDFNLPNAPAGMPPQPMSKPMPQQMPQQMPQIPQAGQQQDSSIDYETLRNIFPDDPTWHETDTNNFNPYPDNNIDQPQPEDFGFTPQQVRQAQQFAQPQQIQQLRNQAQPLSKTDELKLPEFDDARDDAAYAVTKYSPAKIDILHSNPLQSSSQNLKRSIARPFELFVKGKDFKAVNSGIRELAGILEETENKVEASIADCGKDIDSLQPAKNAADLLQKKLMYIDTKLFPSESFDN